MLFCKKWLQFNSKYSFLQYGLLDETIHTFILKQLFNDLVPSQASFATFDNVLNAWKLLEDKFQKFCWLVIHKFFPRGSFQPSNPKQNVMLFLHILPNSANYASPALQGDLILFRWISSTHAHFAWLKSYYIVPTNTM